MLAIIIGSGLVGLIVAVVALGLIYWLVSLLPLPDPFPKIILVVFVLIAIILVLRAFGILDGGSIVVR